MDELNYTELQAFKKGAAYVEERLERITLLYNREPKTERDYNEALMLRRHIGYMLHDMLASVDNGPRTLAKTVALQRRCNGLLTTMLD